MIFAARIVGQRQITSLFVCSTSSISAAKPQIGEQKRTIYSKYAVPERERPLHPPWPYKERGYKWFHQFLDHGVNKRLGENSKLIVVEGNVGSGKSQIAKDLADALGFYHIPDPNYDHIGFIDSYGDDQRLYYHLFPETCRRFDTRMFYENPTHRNVARFQWERYMCRVEAFQNALAHIMNTGQGVVLEKCWHTDKVYVEAMYKKGYLTDAFRWYYHKELTPHLQMKLLLEAHCVIYLDTPVDKCLENIKKHHKPWEWQNDVMDYTYLEEMEKGLKSWLKEYNRHAEIITYDWKDGGDARTIAEDLEHVDLDEFKTHENEKFETWHLFPDDDDMNEYRIEVTSKKFEALQYFNATPTQVAELWIPGDDIRQRKQVMEMISGPYAAGYSPQKGDKTSDMVFSMFRDQITNKKWVEYRIQDMWHLAGMDIGYYNLGRPEAPTFPEEFLKPQSPYKADHGCMADASIFLRNGQHVFIQPEHH